MAFESDFLRMMPITITVKRKTGEDTGGKVTLDSGTQYKCHVQDDVKYWKWEDALEKGARRMVYVNTGSDALISVEDEITFPASVPAGHSKAFPVYVIHRHDEDGYHHTEIYV